ncbi:MAG: TerB family tellurite resistance protein, partial [Deltaproteobacteria bacterium]|nr:TerB family tellurite resistance protein [Nannocystaceae bacterium]
MGLDPIKQWTLLCGGLVAHADGVLDGHECERLMAVLEAAEGLGSDEYTAWMAAIADAARLEELLAALPPPPPEHHRELLEGAWVMAVVDGRRSPEESQMIDRLAARMGVEPVQLEYWRDAWTAAEQEFARAVAAVLGWVIG